MIKIGRKTFEIKYGDYVVDNGKTVRLHVGDLSVLVPDKDIVNLPLDKARRVETQSGSNIITKYYLSCTNQKNNSQNNTP